MFELPQLKLSLIVSNFLYQSILEEVDTIVKKRFPLLTTTNKKEAKCYKIKNITDGKTTKLGM